MLLICVKVGAATQVDSNSDHGEKVTLMGTFLVIEMLIMSDCVIDRTLDNADASRVDGGDRRQTWLSVRVRLCDG